jgi:hypothetical protein
MATTPKRIEVRSANGTLMLSLRICDETRGAGNEANASPRRAAQASNSRSRNGSRNSNGNGNENGNGNGNGHQDADAISDAQKRYLFRILADQGLEGDQALSHLKERFGVEGLSNVTKREASDLIEELLGDPATAT